MIASGELPKLIKLNYSNPSMISSLKSDLFWEIGPYLKDYKTFRRRTSCFMTISPSMAKYMVFRCTVI